MWTNNVLFGTIIRDKERGKKLMRRKYNYSPYSRRRRIRWDNVLKVVIPVVVVLVLVITFNFSRIRLAMKGYSWSQQSAVLKLTSDKVKIVIDDDYLDHIDSWLKHSKDVKYYAYLMDAFLFIFCIIFGIKMSKFKNNEFNKYLKKHISNEN